MQRQMAISQFWAHSGLDFQFALTQVKDKLSTMAPQPQNIRIVSAGECALLANQAVFEFCQKLAQHTQTQFISAACTSIHAAILDFYHSDEQSCTIIALELNQSRQQDCLDALDIGISCIEDGLDVVPSCAILRLTKQSEQSTNSPAYYIHDCQILSQQAGMRGTTDLVKRLSQYIGQSEGRKVSFAISSKWGLSVLNGVDAKIKPNWLASAEQDQKHYLSVKPILELQRYQQQLQAVPLLLITLGGGGRVGLLQLSTSKQYNTTQELTLPQSSFEMHDIQQDIDKFKTAEHLKVNNIVDSYQLIRNTLKYPRSRYRGMDNHYFKWSIQTTTDNNNNIYNSTNK